MPVRRSRLNYQSVGGSLASVRLGRAVRFDSLLERDFFVVLDLHPAVVWFEEQPMKIRWIDTGGAERVYVPDVLVTFRKGQFLHRRVGCKLLIELKHRDDLGKNWDSLRPKFRAGVRAAARQGWRFKILTDKHIRGVALQNAEFIRKHLHSEYDNLAASAIKNHILSHGNCTVEQLAAAVDCDGHVHRGTLDAVWALVANGVLATNIEVPISPSAPIFKGFHYEKR
jgi:hypothetical protein